MKKLMMILILVGFSVGRADDVMKDFDGLGENKDLFDAAKSLHPDLNVTVVQERIVKRRNRLEISPELAMISGGDAYINTSSYGLTLNYHIVPWVSVGARYSRFSNTLTSEGENLLAGSPTDRPKVPDIDYPSAMTMGFVNFYPIYGKLNTLNMGITHFDIYLTAGYGNMDLESGTSATWTTGLGVGLWWSQHFSTRLEMRYQTYEAQRSTGAVDFDNTVASLQLGYIL